MLPLHDTTATRDRAFVNFQRRVQRRWEEACHAVGHKPQDFSFSWRIDDNYPHFKQKRGFAVCHYNPKSSIFLQFASKTLVQPVHRQEGLVRHELGHALDFLFSSALDEWAEELGFQLPQTPERRADAIAEIIWGDPILYDHDDVQSIEQGVYPRPLRLGP
jgi:hypothetical protein